MVDWYPLLMFPVLLAFMFAGVPIAFSLFGTAIIFALYSLGVGGIDFAVSAVWGIQNTFTLVAIPLFILMSLLLEKTGIIGDLYDTVYKWSGGLRGGLAVATILAGAIIGAISGVVAAGVIGLALIAYPHMMRYKYDQNLALGTVMGGGTLGQLIPPNLNMIVYASMTGVSVSSLFAGGFSAGLIFIAIFLLYTVIRAYLQRGYAPALAKSDRVSLKEKLTSLKTVILPVMLIVGVIGSILLGIASPTEAAAVGVLGTLVIGATNRQLNYYRLKQALAESTVMTGMVGWILAAAAAFSGVFSAMGGNRLISNIAGDLPGGPWVVLFAAVALIVVLGMFLETLALIMLLAPILTPVVVAEGFDPLWWAILFMVVMQLAYITPPFGFAIFYLKSALKGSVSIARLYRATGPIIALQSVAVAVMVVFPGAVLWLPQLF